MNVNRKIKPEIIDCSSEFSKASETVRLSTKDVTMLIAKNEAIRNEKNQRARNTNRNYPMKKKQSGYFYVSPAIGALTFACFFWNLVKSYFGKNAGLFRR